MASDVPSARIRKLAGFALALSMLLLWLSFVNVRVKLGDDIHFERAIPREHLLWIIAAVVPAGWIMRVPHKRPLFIWAGVFVAASIAMGLWTWSGHQETLDPAWPRVVVLVAWLGIGALIAAMIEARVRPRSVAIARIHRE